MGNENDGLLAVEAGEVLVALLLEGSVADGEDFVKNKDIFQYKDGYVDGPTKPGLGLEIDEDLVKEVSAEGLHWTNPKWRNYDGTMAEW